MTITVGPNAPTTNSQTGIGQAWAGASAAYASDGSYATSTLTSSAQTGQVLHLTGFGFAVPTHATVNGVTLTIKGYETNLANNFNAQLLIAGSGAGANKLVSFTSSDATYTLGGSSDLWSLTPTPTQVNAADFGVGLGPTSWSAGVGGTQVWSVDSALLSITYTPFGTAKSVTATATLVAARKRGIGKRLGASLSLSSLRLRGIGKHVPFASTTLSVVVSKGLSIPIGVGIKLTPSIPKLRASAARLSLKGLRMWVWLKKNLEEDEWTT